MIGRRLFTTAWRFGSPIDVMQRMRRDMDQLLGMLNTPASVANVGVFPAVRLSQNKDSYYVRAELPGTDANDLDIQVTGRNLSISGERKIVSESEKARYHRREREAGKFSRIMSMPGDVDSDKVDASFVNGILTVTIPKSETQKPRQITVK
jgi:HSP20 family protein